MIKRLTIRVLLCISLTYLTFFRVNAQDDSDIHLWYIMKVAEVNKNASRNKIKSIVVSQIDSTGEKFLKKKLYDKNGYLIRHVDYSYRNQFDSIVTVFKKVSSAEVAIEYKFTKGEYDMGDEDCPIGLLHGYLDTMSAGRYSLLTRKYKRISGKIINVTTSLNGVKKESHDFTLMDTTQRRLEKYSGDTIRKKDTLIIREHEKDNSGNLTEVKWYFIKGIVKPVKTEYVKYLNDSLVYHSIEEDEYDKKRRLVSHAEYQGPPLSRYVIERTIYNDSTGEITETHGYNPLSGKPMLIWRYDKRGRILYSEKPEITNIDNGKIIWHRDKGSIMYKYNIKGLLEEVIASVNDVPVVYTFYRYTYY